MPDADREAVHRHLQVAICRWAHAAAAASATGNRVAFIHRVCALHGDGRPPGCCRGSAPRSAGSGSVVPRPPNRPQPAQVVFHSVIKSGSKL